MLKALVKLALVALIANATWRAGSAYLTFYRFKDGIRAAAQYGGRRSTADLHTRIVDLAARFSVPLGDDDFTINRDKEFHTVIDGSYTQPIELLPWYSYPWTLSWHIDTLETEPAKLYDPTPK